MFIWHYTCLSSAWKIFIWRYSYLSFRIQVKFYLLCEDFLDFWAVCPLCSHQCFNDSANRFILLVHSLSCVRSLQLQALQHTRHPCPSLSPRVCSKSCPIELAMPSNHLILCHPLFLKGSLNLSQCRSLFQWVGFLYYVAKVLELQLQHQSFQWVFRVEFLRDWLVKLSLLSEGLSRIFSSTIVQKHQFFGIQPSSQSNSYIHTWPREKP